MAADSNHWVFKTVLPGSAVQQVCVGCFLVPGQNDTVVGRGDAVELFVTESSGRLSSLCRQPMFGAIKDLRTYARPDLARDLLLVLSDSGKLSLLCFSAVLQRQVYTVGY